MNRYLAGNFAPVTEEITAYDLPVTGKIPSHLNGRYLRNGPNPLGVDDPATHIWIAGEGMVHGVRIRDGRAEWYRNRWVRSGSVADRLGEPRRGTPVDERLDFAANVHVIGLGGRTIALVEGGIRPYELTYELDTVGPCDLGATPEGYAANAHSKVDADRGELHSLTFRYGVEQVQHIVMDATTGAVQRTTLIPTPGNPYMHDFALTENHVVIYVSPIVFNPEWASTGRNFVWDADRAARVGVMRRSGGEVRWFEVSPCFAGHTLNSYELGSTLVVDVIRNEENFDVLDIGNGRPTLDRWTIDLEAGTVREQRIDDRVQDFPRLNPAYETRPHRYGYAAACELYAQPGEKFTNALLKHDFKYGTTESHELGPVGEAAFVAADSPTAEDDGYLMAYAHDPHRGAADLVILSAQDFTAPPVARIHLPVRVPLGLHGNWIPDR